MNRNDAFDKLGIFEPAPARVRLRVPPLVKAAR